ncbi:MAG: cytochrome c5 family protein [Proteobacteria bacterium]|nr:cytochrome c5 family protein [Pseudomonadota bacterium]
MSDASSQTHDDGPHEGPIKTPKQLVLAVLFAFVVPISIIVLLVSYVSSNHQPNVGTDAMTPEGIAARIHPVGTVEVKDPNDLAAMKTGEQVFAAQCTTCHTAGALGAPKFGDADAWAPRVKTGYAALLNSALHGKGNMPAQGGGDFTDLEIGRAVVYMANKVGANFEEPKLAPPTAAAPAPVAAAPAAATSEATAAAPAAEPAQQQAAAAPAAGTPPPLFAQVCSACHATGVAGAPKVGDKAAWAPRIAQGIDGLVASAIKGKGAMPPKGGSTASEADIKAVVTYMVDSSK